MQRSSLESSSSGIAVFMELPRPVPALATPMTEAPAEPSTVPVAALFREHAAYVANLLRRLGVPESEVDDGLQEVFIVAHRAGGYRVGPALPRTWLSAIAVHVAGNVRRSVRRRRLSNDSGESIVERPASTESPERAREMAEALSRVQRVLDEMPESLREVFVLFEIFGESGAAIAAALEIPIGTFHTRLRAARERFAKIHERMLAASASGVRRSP